MLTFVIVCQSMTSSANLDNMAKKTNAEFKRAVARHRAAREKVGGNPDEDSDDGSEVDPSQVYYPTDENGEPLDNGRDFIETAEGILAYFSYLNRRSFWRKGDDGAY